MQGSGSFGVRKCEHISGAPSQQIVRSKKHPLLTIEMRLTQGKYTEELQQRGMPKYLVDLVGVWVVAMLKSLDVSSHLREQTAKCRRQTPW